MPRRGFLRAGVLGAAGTVLAPGINVGRCLLHAATGPAPVGPPIEVSTRAVDVVLGSTVIDMLGLLTLEWGKLWQWHDDPSRFALPDFRGLEVSGVNVFHPAVETGDHDTHATARRWLDGWNRLIDGKVCFLDRVVSLPALRNAARHGRIGIILGFQNSEHFRNAADVALFHSIGQRVSQLTYNGRNRLGSGCFVRDRGLTDFGAEIVRAMNSAGMAIDLSHCGERTSRDAIDLSSAPVLVTHANCEALNPRQPRCKSDKTIERLARRGGVMGITVVKAFVGRGTPSLEDLLDHFDHVARVAGVEHVGLGSDVDVTAVDPQTGSTRSLYAIRGLDLSARVFQIADGLLRREWTASQVELVLGGNFSRALESIWSAAPDAGPEAQQDLPRDPFCPSPNPVPPPGVRTVATGPADVAGVVE